MVLRGGGRLSFLSGQGFTGGSDRKNGYPELVSGSCLAWHYKPLQFPRPLRKRVRVRGKLAFTLAEVLITLGIIGIVASMTMPTLIGKYKKKELANRAKVAYSILSQAIKLSEVENGEVKYWDTSPGGGHGFENTRLFDEKYILPYLKGYKYCASGKSEEAVKKCGLAAFSASHTYFLSNGVAISAQPSASPTHEANFVLNLDMDVNGPQGPNRMGYDQFQFYLYREYGNFAPISEVAALTREDILRGKNVMIDGDMHYVACKKSKTEDNDIYYRHGCTALLMMDGWEFKDDYPW